MSKVVDVVSNTNHAYGQLARANYGRADTTPATVGGDQWYPPAEGCPRSGCPSRGAPRNAPQSEDFLWDGLALIQRGDEQFINEPHIGGGNPVASSKGTSYFNDALGTTVGSKSNGKYSAAVLSAFGESLETQQCEATSNFKHQTSNSQTFFTGKPFVEGLGHAFWMRNYRAGLAKWQTADPMGYPDGWNQLAYCNNGVTEAVDLWGGLQIKVNVREMNVTDNPCGEWTVGPDGREFRWRMKTWNDMYDVYETEKSELASYLEKAGVGAMVIGSVLAVVAIVVEAPVVTVAGVVMALAGIGIDVAINENTAGPIPANLILNDYLDQTMKYKSYKEFRE